MFDNDAALVTGCLEGRKDAWDSFVDRFSKLISWSIRKTFSNSAFKNRFDLREEVFQDVFQSLLEKETLRALREVESIAKYLSVLACHAALDKIKILSRSERKSVSREDWPGSNEDNPLFFSDVIADDDKDPATLTEKKETESILSALILALEPKEKACIELHYLENWTLRQIGETLGLPTDTVSTVIRRTRESLRRRLARKGLGR